MRRVVTIAVAALLSLAAVAQTSGTVRDGMEAVSERYGVYFAYDSNLPVDTCFKGQDFRGKSLQASLKTLFAGTGIEWRVKGRYILLTAPAPADPLEAFAVIGEPGTQMDTIAPSVITERRYVERNWVTLYSDVADIRSIVSPLGEGDPVKWAQRLPGVSSGADGMTAYYVRGGNFGNNQFALDDVPIYGYSHLLGLTSIVPIDVVDRIEFSKSAFNGNSSNFTSSFMNISSRGHISPGNKTSISANNFLINVNTEWNGGGNLSYILSARVSPLASEFHTAKSVLGDRIGGLENMSSDIGDLFCKLIWNINSGKSIDLYILSSLDSYSFTPVNPEKDSMGWSNIVGMARYIDGSIDGSLKVQASINRYSSFQSVNKAYREVNQELTLQSTMTESILFFDRKRRRDNVFSFNYGLKCCYALFSPGQIGVSNKEFHTILSSAYVQGEYFIHDNVSVMADIKANLCSSFKTKYHAFSPDISLMIKYYANKQFGIQASFDKTSQFYHTLEGLPLGWSLDMLVPSSAKIGPEKALQTSLNLIYMNENNSASLGGFYKKMDGLVYYKYAPSLFSGALAAWEENVDTGIGHSYGVEFQYQYNNKELNATGTYTLSKTDREGFITILDGDLFPARFDRRHMFNANIRWKGFSASFIFQSGHWENGESMKYVMHCLGDSWTAEYYNGINDYHMPYVLRLDLGYSLSFTTKKCKHDVSLGVFNVTNHYNPFILFYDTHTENWKEVALLPVLPNFSYRISF